LLADELRGVLRVPKASTTHIYDYIIAYVGDLRAAVAMEAIRRAKLHIGVDPLGGGEWRGRTRCNG
jgi:phosphoglucomutase